MSSSTELKNEINSISKEISYLFKRQDGLNKQLQELCHHEHKILLTNVEYHGTFQNVEYCNACGKTISL